MKRTLLQRSTRGAARALTLAASGCGDAVVTFEEPLAVSESEIVNGQNASPNEWPWQIALRRDGDFQCGGVILNSSWVLTAAHCVWGTFEPRPISEYTIIAGDHISSASSGNEQQRTAAEIIVHPNWGTAYDNGNGVFPGDKLNDVALIRVNQPFALNQRVKSIALSDDYLDPGTEVWATGWGLTSGDGEDPSDVLQEVQSEVVEPTSISPKLVRSACSGGSQASEARSKNSGGTSCVCSPGARFRFATRSRRTSLGASST